MEFKKKMILDYGAKLNEILGNYKAEYLEIMAKTLQSSEDNLKPSVAQKDDLYNTIAEQQLDTSKRTDIDVEPANIQHIDVPKTQCTIEDAVFEDQTNLFDHSINMMASSVNQSFFNGERRRARRQTGKKIIKRKLVEELDLYVSKRQKTEIMESFLVLLADQLKAFKENNGKKVSLVENESLLKERKDLDKLKSENIAISMKIEQELKELKTFKETLMSEMKRIEEEKKNNTALAEQTILEKIKREKREIQEEYIRESKRIEAERSILIEEKKTLEELKAAEIKRIEMEKIQILRQKEDEIRRIATEKLALEKQINEQNNKLEAERKLLQKERERIKQTLEEERERINQTLFEEREKINQTFLEISNRPRVDQNPLKTQKLDTLNIELPLSFKVELERKKTLQISTPKSISEVFQLAKREHQKQHTQVTSITKEVPESQFFESVTRNFPIFDINKINPHSLYKKSIDIQSNPSDPKKYIPKTFVPFYTNEDEFESEDKKFHPALFTKDPKLNYIVKCQNHDEIRAFFGNKKDIDVEVIFSEVENVSNYSPNKLKRRKSK